MKFGWQVKKLNEIALISSGNSAPQKKEYFNDGEFPFFRTSDVGAVHLSDSLTVVRDHLNKKGTNGLRLFKKGTILFSKSGASTFLNHRVVMGCDGYVSSHLATITPSGDILSKYLYYYLTTIDAREIAPNSAYPSLKVSDIGKLQIPLPPLEEQKKIVAILNEKLDKIAEAKKLREEAIKDTEKILSQTLKEIFEEGKRKGWEKKELGKVTTINPIKSEIREISNNEKVSFIPMAYVSEITQSIEIQETKILSEVRKGYTYFKRGDIIIAKVTPCMENGKIAYTKNLIHEYGFGSSEFHVIRVNENFALPKFIYQILRTEDFRKEAETKMTGTSGLKRVPKEFIEKYKIIIPPVVEQQKIVKKLDELSARVASLRELQKEQLSDLKKLEKSLLREAFRGEV